MADEVTMSGGDADFDKFFDDLTSGKDFTAPAPAAEAAPTTLTPAPEPAPEAVKTEEPALAPEAAKVEEPAPAPAPEPTTREVLETFKAAIEQQRQPAPAPQPQALQPQAPTLYNDAELATLAQVQKDWPDFAKYAELLLRGALTVNNQRLSEEFSKYAGDRDQVIGSVADAQQRYELQQLIPDYAKVRDPVIQWVHEDKSIPDYLRRAYVSVTEQGSPAEIADLVGRWKEATGVKTPQPIATKKEHELSEAAKQAAQTLAPVISQRTAPAQAEPQTFDEGFEAALKLAAKM